jgi:hypothetical protein
LWEEGSTLKAKHLLESAAEGLVCAGVRRDRLAGGTAPRSLRIETSHTSILARLFLTGFLALIPLAALAQTPAAVQNSGRSSAAAAFALTNPDAKIRLKALDEIKDQAVLADIASRDADGGSG